MSDEPLRVIRIIPENHLEVAIDPDTFEVVINLDHDRNGVGHITFSPNQARNLAKLLMKKASDAEFEHVHRNRPNKTKPRG